MYAIFTFQMKVVEKIGIDIFTFTSMLHNT